jgi:hypothetical protein
MIQDNVFLNTDNWDKWFTSFDVSSAGGTLMVGDNNGFVTLMTKEGEERPGAELSYFFRGIFLGISREKDFAKLFPQKIPIFPDIFWGWRGDFLGIFHGKNARTIFLHQRKSWRLGRSWCLAFL